MRGDVHEEMTKWLFPQLKRSTIKRVNSAIDNPTKAMMAYNQSMRQVYGGDLPTLQGLDRIGHRKDNHDIMTAMVAGFMNGGAEDMQAAAHLMQDQLSDHTRMTSRKMVHFN